MRLLPLIVVGVSGAVVPITFLSLASSPLARRVVLRHLLVCWSGKAREHDRLAACTGPLCGFIPNARGFARCRRHAVSWSCTVCTFLHGEVRGLRVLSWPLGGSVTLVVGREV